MTALVRHSATYDLAYIRYSRVFDVAKANVFARCTTAPTVEHCVSKCLVDLASVVSFRASYGGLSNLVHLQQAMFPPNAQKGRCAILATRDLSFGMARMYQQIADERLPLDILATKTMTEACAWLDIPESAVPTKRRFDRAA